MRIHVIDEMNKSKEIQCERKLQTKIKSEKKIIIIQKFISCF